MNPDIVQTELMKLIREDYFKGSQLVTDCIAAVYVHHGSAQARKLLKDITADLDTIESITNPE